MTIMVRKGTELKRPLKRIILMLLKGTTKAVHWEDLNINMMIGLTIHKKLVQRRSLNLMLVQNCNINVETALKPANAPNFGPKCRKSVKKFNHFSTVCKSQVN